MASMVNCPLASHFTIDVTWQSSPLIKYMENSVPRVLIYSFCMACIPHRPSTPSPVDLAQKRMNPEKIRRKLILVSLGSKFS